MSNEDQEIKLSSFLFASSLSKIKENHSGFLQTYLDSNMGIKIFLDKIIKLELKKIRLVTSNPVNEFNETYKNKLSVYLRDLTIKEIEAKFPELVKLSSHITVEILIDEVLKGKPIRWTKYMGSMTFREAKVKCENSGLRLPTKKELKAAYDAGTTKSWTNKGERYWTSEEFSDSYAFGFYIAEGYPATVLKDTVLPFRCIQKNQD
ncbi:MAG: hypothetical protein KBF93_22545 [Leptospiraceae bacterium]|nr:hypothetical protein [Leptospiraceae bacterium]